MKRFLMVLCILLAVAPARATDYWYFVDSNGGNNANDEKDLLGFEDGLGEYSTAGVTGGLALISDSNSFQAYTWTAGDVVYLYEIATPTNAAWYTVVSKEQENRLLLDANPVAGTGVAVFTPLRSSSGPWEDACIATSGISEVTGVTIWFASDADVCEQHFDSVDPVGVGFAWTYRGWPAGTQRKVRSTDDSPFYS